MKVIESRIKRALWAVSILVSVGFGGYSVYEFRQEAKWESSFQVWVTRSSEHSKECARLTEEVNAKAGSATGFEIFNARQSCDSTTVDEGVSISSRAMYDAAYTAQRSLGIAIGCPIALWALFFLCRWIWTGKIKGSQLPALARRPFFTKQVRYWVFWILGCAFLFALNVFVLPPGRAVQVVISTAVQAIGLVLVVWAVNGVRKASQKRAEQKRASKPDASIDPP